MILYVSDLDGTLIRAILGEDSVVRTIRQDLARKAAR